MLYDRANILGTWHKAASFVVQAMFLQSGRYFRCMKDVADIAARKKTHPDFWT